MTGQHYTPCAQCPWRKTSAPGWLGASTPEEFVAQGLSDLRMPCHCAVDYEDPNWREQADVAPQCAGRAAFLRNNCKMPRDRELANFVRSVPQNPDVFSFPSEFIEHHSR